MYPEMPSRTSGLQNEGYNIMAVRNLDTVLIIQPIFLRQEYIPYLTAKARNFNIDVERQSPTNTIAKEMAIAGAPEGTVIIAAEQTEGRGRMGQLLLSFTGLYLSIILDQR